MRSPRILAIIESLGYGGAERALAYLLPALKNRGYLFEVAALWPPYELSSELEAAGIPVHRLDLSPWNVFQGTTAIARLIRRGDYNIVHAQLFFAGFYMALSAPFASAPLRVVTFQDASYDSYPAHNFIRKLRKAANGFLMRNFVDGYVAVSTSVARHFEHHLKLSNVAVMVNVVPMVQAQEPEPRSAIRERHGFSANEFVFLMAARYAPEKGHRYLLDALEMLRRENIGPRVVMVGHGHLFQQVKAAIRERNFAGQVDARTALPHSELLRLMRAADAFVLPSTHEGFPLAPAEAMLQCCPVLATSVYGLPDLIEHNVSGLLVPPADPAALAEGMKRLISEPELRARLGRAGRERVLSTISLEILVPQWEAFYENLIGAASA